MLLRVALAGALAALAPLRAPTQAAVRVNGSTTVNPVVAEAAAILLVEASISVQLDTVGGSSGGIAALGDGLSDIAMSSRPLSGHDRAKYPEVDFHSTRIGLDAVALVVSRDVWNGGIRSLSRKEIKALYEGQIEHWSELGGPERRVVFFNKEPGRGTWEVFAAWLYGESGRAPLVSLPEVGSNQEARTKVATTRGAITQLSAAWADGELTFSLSIRSSDGLKQPTQSAVASGDYPLARPLLLVTNGEPYGEVKRVIDFVLSPRGQALVGRHGYLPEISEEDRTVSP